MLFTRHFNPSRLGGKKKWVPYDSPEDNVDLGKAVGKSDWSTYYAAVYLHAERDAEPVLWLGTDDGFKLFLNGAEVLEGHHHDYSGDDTYRVPLRLSKGRNLLLIRIENHAYDIRLKARLTSAAEVVANRKR